MNVTYLGSSKFPALAGESYRRYTWNNAKTPIAFRPVTGNLVGRGHAKYHDSHEFRPVLGGTCEMIGPWFDPSAGQLAVLNENTTHLPASERPDWAKEITGSQGIFHRGMWIDAADNAWCVCSLFYNVKPYNPPTHWMYNLTTGEFSGFHFTASALRQGGYTCPLPPELQAAWNGHDTATCEVMPQGAGNSLHGPGMFSYTRNVSLAANATLDTTMRFQHLPSINPYPGWYPSWRSNGMFCYGGRAYYYGRKGFGANWYGTWDGRGTQITDPPGTLSHPIASLLNPGHQARCTYDDTKGYYSEAYKATLFTATVASILAGNPVWEEIDLSPWVLSASAEIVATVDPATGRCWVMEWHGDADKIRPKLLAFQLPVELIEEDPAMIAELQSQLTAAQSSLTAANNLATELQAEIDAKDAQVATLTGERDAAVTRADDAEAAIVSLNQRIDAAQAGN